MHPTLMTAALSLTLAATAAAAQTPVSDAPAAPAAVFTEPQAYSAYSQPDITQCQTTGALERACTVPAMTAGRYAIIAAGMATSTAADATQAMQIKLGDQVCAASKAIPLSGKKGLRLVCAVNFLTDQPINVTATYSLHNATADAGGPRLGFRRLAWNGVVDSQGAIVVLNPGAAAKK